MILCLERNGQLEVIMERCFVQIGQNKKHLSADFGHRCAYCDDLDEYGGGYRAYHVEHFAPKEKFPELRYDYDNLLYACPWCNRAKWDIWPSDNSKINVVDSEGLLIHVLKNMINISYGFQTDQYLESHHLANI